MSSFPLDDSQPDRQTLSWATATPKALSLSLYLIALRRGFTEL